MRFFYFPFLGHYVLLNYISHNGLARSAWWTVHKSRISRPYSVFIDAWIPFLKSQCIARELQRLCAVRCRGNFCTPVPSSSEARTPPNRTFTRRDHPLITSGTEVRYTIFFSRRLSPRPICPEMAAASTFTRKVCHRKPFLFFPSPTPNFLLNPGKLGNKNAIIAAELKLRIVVGHYF